MWIVTVEEYPGNPWSEVTCFIAKDKQTAFIIATREILGAIADLDRLDSLYCWGFPLTRNPEDVWELYQRNRYVYFERDIGGFSYDFSIEEKPGEIEHLSVEYLNSLFDEIERLNPPE